MSVRLVVMVAGPYSAPTAEGRAANLRRMNDAAAARLGHIPVIGVNAALPVLDAAGLPYTDPLMMEISLALAARCDACLQIGRSPGADREAEAIRGLGRPVFADDRGPAGRSVRLAVPVEIDPASVRLLARHHVHVGIVGAIARQAVADLQVDHIALRAVDEVMPVLLAGREIRRPCPGARPARRRR